MAIKFFDVEKDTHAEFVKKYKDGDLVLSVQTNAAGYLFKDILSEYAGRQATFRMILFGGFAGGIIAIGMAFGAILLSFLERSAQILDLYDVPKEIEKIMQAVIVLSVVVAYEVVKRYVTNKQIKEASKVVADG